MPSSTSNAGSIAHCSLRWPASRGLKWGLLNKWLSAVQKQGPVSISCGVSRLALNRRPAYHVLRKSCSCQPFLTRPTDRDENRCESRLHPITRRATSRGRRRGARTLAHHESQCARLMRRDESSLDVARKSACATPTAVKSGQVSTLSRHFDNVPLCPR